MTEAIIFRANRFLQLFFIPKYSCKNAQYFQLKRCKMCCINLLPSYITRIVYYFWQYLRLFLSIMCRKDFIEKDCWRRLRKKPFWFSAIASGSIWHGHGTAFMQMNTVFKRLIEFGLFFSFFLLSLVFLYDFLLFTRVQSQIANSRQNDFNQRLFVAILWL